MSDAPRRPQLLEIDAPAERIDHEWEAFVRKPEAREPLFGTGTLVAAGLFVLLLGFFVVESVGWIAGMVDERPWLGWTAAGVLAFGFGGLLLLQLFAYLPLLGHVSARARVGGA